MIFLNILINIINIFLLCFITYRYISYKYLLIIPVFISLLCLNYVSSISILTSISITIIFLAALTLFWFYDDMKYIKRIIPLSFLIGLLAIIRIDMASFIYGMYFWAIFWAGLADVEGLHLPLKKRAIRGFIQGGFFTLIMFLFIGIYVLCEYIFFSSNILLINIINELEKMFSGNSLLKIYLIKDSFALIFLPIIYIISIIVLVIKHKKRILISSHPCFWKEMLVINIGLNLYPQALLNSDLEHIIPLVLISSMLIPNIVYFIYYIIKNDYF